MEHWLEREIARNKGVGGQEIIVDVVEAVVVVVVIVVVVVVVLA